MVVTNDEFVRAWKAAVVPILRKYVISIRIACFRAKIRTREFLNTKQEL
jgi:hypothetical protein